MHNFIFYFLLDSAQVLFSPLTFGISCTVRVSTSDVLSHQSAGTVAPHSEEEKLFKSLEEIEVQTLGNLLPDEDELFSGVVDDMGYNAHANNGDDFEDFDLFSSGGGMELEGDDHLCISQRHSDFNGGIPNSQGGSNGSLASEHPYGEHPSRTLFVRNINSNVEDSELRDLFEVRILFLYPLKCLTWESLQACHQSFLEVQLTHMFHSFSNMETSEHFTQLASIAGLL